MSPKSRRRRGSDQEHRDAASERRTNSTGPTDVEALAALHTLRAWLGSATPSIYTQHALPPDVTSADAYARRHRALRAAGISGVWTRGNPSRCLKCKAKLYGAREGLCSGCAREDRKESELKKARVEMQEMIDAGIRRWEETPHRCACGEKVLKAEDVCEKCREKQKDHRERLMCVGMTVNDLPKRYQWAHFGRAELVARVKDAEAIETATAVAKNAAIDRVTLSGPPGAGKTSLACAILNAWAYHRRLNGIYVDARSLSLARSQSKLGQEAEGVKEAMGAAALIIDDLGQDAAQQHGSAVGDVVYARHRNQLPTIVTLYAKPEELVGIYGGGIARRLLEDDGALAAIAVRPRKATP